MIVLSLHYYTVYQGGGNDPPPPDCLYRHINCIYLIDNTTRVENPGTVSRWNFISYFCNENCLQNMCLLIYEFYQQSQHASIYSIYNIVAFNITFILYMQEPKDSFRWIWNYKLLCWFYSTTKLRSKARKK